MAIRTSGVNVSLYHQRYQSKRVIDGVTVTSLTAGLQRKVTATTDCVCHITLNQKWSCII